MPYAHHHYPIPDIKLVGKHRKEVEVPECVRQGEAFLAFLPMESHIFDRHIRLFQRCCKKLFRQGWHIHRHDIILEYANDLEFALLKENETIHATVDMYVRHFRADQLIVHLVINPLQSQY